jgi:hypothetical protein
MAGCADHVENLSEHFGVIGACEQRFNTRVRLDWIRSVGDNDPVAMPKQRQQTLKAEFPRFGLTITI